MRIKTLLHLGLAFVMLNTIACNRKLTCEHIETDKTSFRASGVAYSAKQDVAYEKALHIAKRNLIREIAKDVSTKSGVGQQLIIDSLKKGITVHELEVVCKHHDKHKGSFRSSVAVEMNRDKLLRFYD
ncbi:MAG: hypothetical protein U9N51_01890 [Bacteroidota bacterium]|nr:hypothetical protein [Bacteroidota bacterium]